MSDVSSTSLPALSQSNPLHILGLPFSTFVRAVMLICEELELPYFVSPELKGQPIKIGDETHLQQHPFGKIPVLLFGDIKITETSTILRFIDNQFGARRFQSNDIVQSTQIDQWCAHASIYLDSAIVRNVLLEFVFPKGENGTVRQDVVADNLPAMQNAINIINAQIAGKDFICGDAISLADFVLVPMLDYLERSPLGEQYIPKDSELQQYIQRMRSRPSGSKILVPSQR